MHVLKRKKRPFAKLRFKVEHILVLNTNFKFKLFPKQQGLIIQS